MVDATVAQIDNPEITLDELLTHIKGPDFPTGAEVYGGAPMRQAYETGRGSVTIRAVASIEERKNGRYSIIITEVPYGMSKEGFVDKVRELVLAKKITHIADARDESARGKVRVVVELKKDAYPKKILNQLYKLTGLAKERAHILEGLKIALDHIDEVIKTIRESYDDADKRLMERFGLSEIQAAAILAMQLRRLQGLERDKIEEELKQLHELIKKLEAILADEKEILRVVKEELLAMKEKYGDERRSKIINHELGKFSDEELIPEEESVILLTSENYIKRTLVSDYRRQNRGGKGKRGMTTKEEDVIDQVVQASSHDYLLFFTNMGRIFRLKAYEVPAASLSAKGVAAVNLLQLQPEEKITAIIKHEKNANEDGYLFMATKKGTVKKTPVKDYANVRTNGLIAIKLDEGDELRWIKRTTGENDVIISTSAGQAIRFNEKDTRPMGRSARGVRGVRLRPNDSVVGMDIVTGDDQTLLVVSEKGFGKRTKVSNFPSHKRGGVGIKAAVVTAKTGPIISVQTIDPEITESLLVSQNGQTIRLGLSDIKLLGRTTQGVTIMRLSDGDAVSSIGLMADRPQDEGN